MHADEGNCVDVQGDVLFVCTRECVFVCLCVLCTFYACVLLNSKC